MLGKYIMQSFAEDTSLCTVAVGRSKCKTCTHSIKGDLRDMARIEKIIDHFQPETIMTAVKPPLLAMHYRTYIELNLLAMIELGRLAKGHGVRDFIYVSSIAASGHYHTHTMAKESDPQPKYTEYQAPYDISKRVSEDALLAMHEEGVFNVVSIRTSGIIGGKGDPYDYMRWPVLMQVVPDPPTIDCDYAGNIADMLYVVFTSLRANPALGGEFYYYTGEHLPESVKTTQVAEMTGKRVVHVPRWICDVFVDWWHWARWDPHTYSSLDLIRMGFVGQTFDQSKFYAAFDFKPKYTMAQALEQLYGPQ